MQAGCELKGQHQSCKQPHGGIVRGRMSGWFMTVRRAVPSMWLSDKVPVRRVGK